MHMVVQTNIMTQNTGVQCGIKIPVIHTNGYSDGKLEVRMQQVPVLTLVLVGVVVILVSVLITVLLIQQSLDTRILQIQVDYLSQTREIYELEQLRQFEESTKLHNEKSNRQVH